MDEWHLTCLFGAVFFLNSQKNTARLAGHEIASFERFASKILQLSLSLFGLQKFANFSREPSS